MGGVDLLDSLIGLYRINLKSKKWYHKVFGQLIDITVVNAWLIYKDKNKNLNKNYRLLRTFLLNIAENLCNGWVRIRGRPLSSEEEPLKKIVCQEKNIILRKDGMNHWPEWIKKRLRCKLENCLGTSRVMYLYASIKEITVLENFITNWFWLLNFSCVLFPFPASSKCLVYCYRKHHFNLIFYWICRI